jgi:DNA-binding NarL/FixJ family response regulator
MERPHRQNARPPKPDAPPKTGGRVAARVSDTAIAPRFTRVLIVDDHDVVREGLTALLGRAAGMLVVGYAATGEEAVAAAKVLTPNVIVMDLVLPEMNGLDASRLILAEWPLTHIIALSGCHTSDHVHRALDAGARGYVTKTSAGADLVLAIATVEAGEIFVSPGIQSMSIDSKNTRRSAGGHLEHLSQRERQVLGYLVKGSSSADIGRELLVSPKSVDTYRHRIMVKLGVRNRAELIRLALEYELTTL